MMLSLQSFAEPAAAQQPVDLGVRSGAHSGATSVDAMQPLEINPRIAAAKRKGTSSAPSSRTVARTIPRAPRLIRDGARGGASAVKDEMTTTKAESAPDKTSAAPQVKQQKTDQVQESERTAIVKAFCTVNAPSAVELRIATQMNDLKSVEVRVLKESEELSRRTVELESWMKRRDEAMAKADASLVSIYARMKPDVAAQQLVAMSDEVAIAILAKVPIRAAGAIFNELASDKAARLASRLSGAAARRGEPGT
jgi:flagellar motility protein MotE (MotC chaperone)